MVSVFERTCNRYKGSSKSVHAQRQFGIANSFRGLPEKCARRAGGKRKRGWYPLGPKQLGIGVQTECRQLLPHWCSWIHLREFVRTSVILTAVCEGERFRLAGRVSFGRTNCFGSISRPLSKLSIVDLQNAQNITVVHHCLGLGRPFQQ